MGLAGGEIRKADFRIVHAPAALFSGDLNHFLIREGAR
jgi:hypothetical protein